MKYYIPITDEEERECIRKAQARDKDSFGRLVEKYAGMLKGYCIGDLGCPFDNAEDVMQEAFRRAWESISSFKYESKFSTWLCTIARNHYLNMCRDRDNSAEEFDDGKQHSNGRLADNMTRRDCVQRQIAKVREEYGNVITLVHLHDMSYKDAAQTLQWTVEQVRKRLHKALKEAGPLFKGVLIMEKHTPDIPCSEIQENMYDYLTGRLEPAQRSIIAGHLISCSACRAEHDELKITLGLLDQIKPPQVSEGFTERVMQSLEPKVIPFTKRPVYRIVMQGAAAAIVVLAVVSVIKLLPTSKPDTSTIRGGDTTTAITETCKKAVGLYNKGTSASDLKLKESLLKDALTAGCTDNKVLALIHNNLADCSEQQGRLDDAIVGYTKALEFDQQLYTAFLGLGDIAKKKGQTTTAISYYQSALELMKKQGVIATEIEQAKNILNKYKGTSSQ